VSASSILRQHRTLRWFVPACVAGVASLAAGGAFTAQASSGSLPKTTPAALLAAVQSAPVPGFSGTIVGQLSLGLPDLPALGGSPDGASTASLLSGSHTMRFWYGGPDRQRVALLGTTSETDIFHSGRDLWQWESDTHLATHTVLPAGQAHRPARAELTPQQLAERALAAISPSTQVTIVNNRRVADRSAYQLVLTPRDTATRVSSVRIAIDGSTKMPLGVQVYARHRSSPAIDVAFSDVTFKTPSADNFRFTPPPGATVHQGVVAGQQGWQSYQPAARAPERAGSRHQGRQSNEPAARAPERAGSSSATIGSGWTAIVEYRTSQARVAEAAGPLLSRLKAVRGSWGQGRLLDSALVSVLVTDDGRVFAGAVEPSALYAAAATHR
jgi:outer membrane lipoprotein-sorting protein